MLYREAELFKYTRGSQVKSELYPFEAKGKLWLMGH